MKYKYIVRKYKNVEGVIDLPEGLSGVEVDEAILAHVDANTPEGMSLEIITWSGMAIKQANTACTGLAPESPFESQVVSGTSR